MVMLRLGSGLTGTAFIYSLKSVCERSFCGVCLFCRSAVLAAGKNGTVIIPMPYVEWLDHRTIRGAYF